MYLEWEKASLLVWIGAKTMERVKNGGLISTLTKRDSVTERIKPTPQSSPLSTPPSHFNSQKKSIIWPPAAGLSVSSHNAVPFFLKIKPQGAAWLGWWRARPMCRGSAVDLGSTPGPGPFAACRSLSLALFPVTLFSCTINNKARKGPPKKRKIKPQIKLTSRISQHFQSELQCCKALHRDLNYQPWQF